MATNRAHRETPEELINSVINGDPTDAVNLLISSISNFLNNEIAATANNNPPQTSLMFMGIHSAVLTVSEVLFRDRAASGYKKFLEEFMDEDTEGKKFSLISQEIHAWRNILVHGWLSLRGHNIEYDYQMREGFKNKGNDLYINPKIYLELYLTAFNKNGRIWQYIEKMTGAELIKAQDIIKQKYSR